MKNMLSTLFCCGSSRSDYTPLDEKRSILGDRTDYQKTKTFNIDDTESLAQKAIIALIHSDKRPLDSINAQLSRDEARTTSWAESLAQSILDHLAEAIKPGKPIGDALRETYGRVRDAALASFEWAKEHPVFLILIALGILCLIAPWVVEVLGFTAEGVAAGSWAARWQSLYGGVIEEDSLFAWLQSFGALH